MTCQFVPPYLVRALEERADRRGMALAQSTLGLDERFRALREAAPGVLPAVTEGTATSRAVYDARHSETLPGTLVRGDGASATQDPAVDEAYDYAGEVLALFAEVFHRRSVDDRGTGLTLTVHYGRAYDNAFWDGSQLVFGDGDGEIFDRFTKPRDVLAHEFAHGVTQFTAGFTYQGQSGALNESMSDVFASMSKQRVLGQTADQADWLIGEGLFLPGVAARALRSMAEPGTAYDDPRLGKDPQVGSMSDYVTTNDDNGGVHLNSGIPNRAFALAATALGGQSWGRAGQIWYAALTGPDVGSDTDFAAFARAAALAAGRLFPDDPTVARAVEDAWTTVGVLGGPVAPGPVPVVPTGTVAVSRSGGFAGLTRTGALDLDTDAAGPQVRDLLSQVDPAQLVAGETHPDRFVYNVK
ncbi:MAG: family metallopeptidase [Friedmanniella sp.]|nr:family metallopeptidase [Friedmanniella sp.]